MPTFFLTLLLAVYQLKPDLSLKFNDISITRSLALAKMFGVILDLPFKLEGRISLLQVEFRNKIVVAKMEKILLDNDSSKEPAIRYLKGHYNRHTAYWDAKAEMLGGLVELTGVIPK